MQRSSHNSVQAGEACITTRRVPPTRPTHHPVVNVTPHGVVAAYTNKGAVPGFLDWSGLRIPTRFEWLWAALGPPDQDWHLLPRHYVSGSVNPGVYLCQKCGKPAFGLDSTCAVLSPRTYPWGTDPPRAPTTEGGIWASIVFIELRLQRRTA